MQNPSDLSRATENLKREWDRETEEFKHEQAEFDKTVKETQEIENDVHERERIIKEKDLEIKRLVQEVLLKKRHFSESIAKVQRMRPVLENKKMRLNMQERRIEQEQHMLKEQIDRMNREKNSGNAAHRV